MNTVQEKWDEFDAMVIPKNAPDVQRREMRRAFYAGVESLLVLQHSMGDVSDSAGVAMIEGWHDECRRFAQEVVDGTA